MKHLKTFESFSVNEEEGKFRKFFTGHDDKASKEATKEKFYADLDKFEQEAKEDSNMVCNRDFIEKKAIDNNFKGKLVARQSASDNKVYVIYETGRTGLEELGTVAAGTVAVS
jgi:UDP-2,3-diacylglucosamine pyrophosphatase LpxH